MVNQLTRTDRNGRLGCSMHGLANWATKRGNGLTRPLMESVAGVHKDAELPRFAAKPFEDEVRKTPPAINAEAPARGEALYLRFAEALRGLDLPVETGEFGADMQVELINDGPVTIPLDIPPATS